MIDYFGNNVASLRNKDFNMDKQIHKQDSMKGREQWIDGLRGFATILVLFGHICTKWPYYYIWTSPVKIPLFFIISGICFNEHNNKYNILFLKLYYRIVIPWIFLTLLPVKLLWSLIRMDMYRAIEYILGFISGKSYWYIPCCLFAEVIFFIIKKYLNKDFFIILIGFGTTVLGLYLHSVGCSNFAQILNAMVAQVFLAYGMALKHLFIFFDKTTGSKRVYRSLIIIGGIFYIIYTALSIWAYPLQSIDVHLFQYYNYLLCFSLIFVGCTTIIILFKLTYRGKLLAFFGRYSLVFYLVHYVFRFIYEKAAVWFGKSLNGNLFSVLIEFIFLIVTCSVTAILLDRYCPFLIGKYTPYSRIKGGD